MITYAHTAIDTIQSVKKQVVKTFVNHNDLVQVLNTFVDAQTAYTKAAVDTSFDTFTKLNSILLSSSFMDEFYKFSAKKVK